jgi:hypothetical protein
MNGICVGAAIALTACLPFFAESVPKEFTEQQKRWWAIQKVEKPAPPPVRNQTWVRTPVDLFILSKLEERELKPNPPADKITLLRRAHLVLTGLPPSAADAQRFLSDSSPNAYEKVVDGLLASPHYGERWARHWLDLARYADSEGFKADETRPNIWRYRDYVIRSFNSDKPYDRFVQEQIAGQEMFSGNPDAAIATGFLRHFPDESNAANIPQRRQELLHDITDATASTFMGLTYACARCHDHKYDPILQKDYYRLQAFFSNVRIEDNRNLLSGGEYAEWKRRQEDWEDRTAPVRQEIDALLKPHRESLYQARLSRFPADMQEILTMPPEQRNAFQWQMYHKAKPQVEFTEKDAAAKLKGEQKERYKALKAELAKFDGDRPEPLPVAQTMMDNSAEAPKTFVLSGGAYSAPMNEVQPGFLSILDPSDARYSPSADGSSTGRRTALARWLTSAENPLTSRVIANRTWHYLFGRGLSSTPSDFGMMGERPANRELLNYLAARLVEQGWSLKKLQREILLSNTFQQSSDYRADAAEADPGNKFAWRYDRRRLEGEAIRDSMLAVSGALNTKMYGPGVFPPLPPGMTTRGGWEENADPAEANRRSVYVFVRRNTRYPMFETFDFPDTHESCARRNTTVSSTQALELLNNELVIGWAKQLAARARDDAGMSRASQVERAWKLVYSRDPAAGETAAALAFLDRQTKIAGSADQAFVDFCHMLMNSNEFVYIN